jgi:hypothetical protein
MSEHSIFGETGDAGQGSRSLREREMRRPKAAHGLFGSYLLPADGRTNDSRDDEDTDDLPVSRS